MMDEETIRKIVDVILRETIRHLLCWIGKAAERRRKRKDHKGK